MVIIQVFYRNVKNEVAELLTEKTHFLEPATEL